MIALGTGLAAASSTLARVILPLRRIFPATVLSAVTRIAGS